MKNQQIEEQVEENPEDLPFVPPEVDYVSEQYMVEIPISDKHFESPWKLRLYAAKTLERRLGDHVQVKSMKVKKPHLVAKSKARLLKRVPTARLYVTVEF